MNVVNGHARKVGLATIGDGTRRDCSEEYPPNSWSTEADVVLAELKYFRYPPVVYVLDSAFLSSR